MSEQPLSQNLQEKLLNEVKAILNGQLDAPDLKRAHLEALMEFHVKQIQQTEIALLKTQGQLDAYRDMVKQYVNGFQKPSELRQDH